MIIGIIGMGDMGSLCARKWAEKGYTVHGCDLPENFEKLQERFEGTSVQIFQEAQNVVSQADFLLYAVETANIKEVVAESADFIKSGTIVAGQTSVKHPEIEAFEKSHPSTSATLLK